MDEQTIQEQAEATSPEPEYTPEAEAPSVEVPEGTEPEVSIDSNGEVQFREDFFGDIPNDEPEPDIQPNVPSYYTADELKATPYEEWDINRLPEQFREYANIVRVQLEQRRAQQLAQAQAQAQIQQRSDVPPGYTAPHEYTPKELADEARKAAMQKLGLTDEDDFDDYEPEHRAALQMAMNEISQKDYAARQEYARVSKEYQDLQKFNAEIVRRPDYVEFNNWFNARMKAEGLTPEQVNTALQQAVDAGRGNNWATIQNAVTAWYREFRSGRQQGRPGARTQKPPVLESTGSGYEGRGSVNLRDFGGLDIDGQAQALMRMGIV